MNMLLDIVNSEMFQTIQLVVVIVGGVLCISGMLIKMFPDYFKSFIKRHIVDEFHGPDICFDCSKTNCDGCPIKEGFNSDGKIQD